MQVITKQHKELCAKIEGVLYPWRKLLIAVDGRDHSGKTTIASFIAWQYSIPVIYTDYYLVKDATPMCHDYEAIANLIVRRHGMDRPVIVEGIKMLNILKNVGCEADFLVITENTSCNGSIGEEITEYTDLYRPYEKANFTFRWSEHG
jgi:ATP-dependent protease Clp ATPase subunit